MLSILIKIIYQNKTFNTLICEKAFIYGLYKLFFIIKAAKFFIKKLRKLILPNWREEL